MRLEPPWVDSRDWEADMECRVCEKDTLHYFYTDPVTPIIARCYTCDEETELDPDYTEWDG